MSASDPQIKPASKPATPTVPLTASSRERVTGVDIRIDRAGEGPTLAVLNGLLGLNVHWFGCLGPLISRAEVLLLQPPILEMRGPGCSISGVARLIVSVLETLTDKPAVLVGNSLGGHVALRLALERPDLVRGLVLVGSSGLFERSYEKGAEHNPSRAWLDKKISDLFYSREAIHPNMVDDVYAELSRRTSARALVKLGRSAKNDHLGDRLHEIKVPVLLAWGRNDIITPPAVAEKFHSLLPNSRLRWIDKCGHAPQIECPEELGNHIADFLDELAKADARDISGANQGVG